MSAAIDYPFTIQEMDDGPGPLTQVHDGLFLQWSNERRAFVMAAAAGGGDRVIVGSRSNYGYIQRLQDGPGALGAGDNGKALVWNDATKKFVMATVSGGDASTLEGHDSAYFLAATDYTAADVLAKILTVDIDASGLNATMLQGNAPAVFLSRVDTRANVLASTPSAVQVAFCSDTLEMAFWNGSGWYVAPLELISQANAKDMGLLPPMVANDRAGYTADYVTDKTIYNSAFGGSAATTNGGVRVSSSTLQAYLNGTWNDVVTGFRFREISANNYALEHKPIGFTLWIEVDSGNSQSDLGLNGLPLVQGYQVSMGAYPPNQLIASRTITT